MINKLMKTLESYAEHVQHIYDEIDHSLSLHEDGQMTDDELIKIVEEFKQFHNKHTFHARKIASIVNEEKRNLIKKEGK